MKRKLTKKEKQLIKDRARVYMSLKKGYRTNENNTQ